MKKGNRVLAIVLTLCFILSLLMIEGRNMVVYAATVQKVGLNVKILNLQVGESKSLKAIISPTSAKNEKLKWTSNNKKVAVISSSGNVKAVSAGTAMIKVTAPNGKTAACKVTVKEKNVQIQSITLNKTEVTLNADDTLVLKATVKPSNAKNRNITWESSDEEVAFVDDDGTVLPFSSGTAIITARAENKVKATCRVTVLAQEEIEAMIVLNTTYLVMQEGEEGHLSATITPEGTDDFVTWESSDESIAEVDGNGTVYGLEEGQAIITATLENGKYAQCKVVVNGSELKFDDEMVTPIITLTPAPTTTATPDPILVPTETPVAPNVTATPVPTAIPTKVPTPAPATSPAPVSTPTRITLSSQKYVLKSKANSNLVLDVGGGANRNGAAVQLYSANQSAAQTWYLENHSDGTVSFIPECASTRVLDIMRTNNSYSGKLQAGCTVDIYDHNDCPAQDYYIEQYSDGSCVIRLASNTNVVIQASSADQEAKMVAGNFDANNNLQKWYFEAVTAQPISEREAYVYNTAGLGLFVRSSASASSSKVGGFNEGQKLTVIGNIENGWYKVRGNDSKTGAVIEGYSHGDFISFSAATSSGTADQFQSLRAKYPHGSIWNSSYMNGKAIQCVGYAYLLGYELTGVDTYNWTKSQNLSALKSGDILAGSAHTIMVTAVDGDTITFTDCNYTKDKVRWDVKISRQKLSTIIGSLNFIRVKP